MAYAKSKSAYDARIRMFVEELAESQRMQFFEPLEKTFSTLAEAKKFRFDMYGYMNALAHEKPLRGLSPETIERDRDTSERAKQWMITLTPPADPSAPQVWTLIAKPKTNMDDLSDMFNAMEERRKQRMAHANIPLSDSNALPQPIRRALPPTIEESLERQRLSRIGITDNRVGSTIPSADEFYRTIAGKKLIPEQRDFILPYIHLLPDPFIGFATPSQLFAAAANALALTTDELGARTGMITFFNLVWEQAKIFGLKASPLAQPKAANFTEELYGTAGE